MKPSNFIWLILEIALVIALFNACFPPEYSRRFVGFDHGGITSEGHYDPDMEKAVCTPDKIVGSKFRIHRNFKSDYKIIVYFYDVDENLVAVDTVEETVYSLGWSDMPDDAKSIRIVLLSDEGFSDWDLFWLRFNFNVEACSYTPSLFDRMVEGIEDLFD